MGFRWMVFAVAVAAGFGAEVRASTFCKDPPPAAGSAFTGYITLTLDGNSLCVIVGFKPGEANEGPEVEVVLADFHGPGQRDPGGFDAARVMADIAMGQVAECVASETQDDPAKLAAVCTINGESIGDRMRRRGVREKAR